MRKNILVGVGLVVLFAHNPRGFPGVVTIESRISQFSPIFYTTGENPRPPQFLPSESKYGLLFARLSANVEVNSFLSLRGFYAQPFNTWDSHGDINERRSYELTITRYYGIGLNAEWALTRKLYVTGSVEALTLNIDLTTSIYGPFVMKVPEDKSVISRTLGAGIEYQLNRRHLVFFDYSVLPVTNINSEIRFNGSFASIGYGMRF